MYVFDLKMYRSLKAAGNCTVNIKVYLHRKHYLNTNQPASTPYTVISATNIYLEDYQVQPERC